jgi:hypothetical protein
MAKNDNGQKMHTTEFGRFALNSSGVPEKFEEWMVAMYGISPRTKKKKRK